MNFINNSKPDSKPNSSEKLRDQWQRKLSLDSKMPFSAYKVAIAISWHINRNEGCTARPGINTLAKLTGLHRTTVMRAVRWLEARGHHQVQRTRVGRRNMANRYAPLLTQAKPETLRNRYERSTNGAEPLLPPSSTTVRPPSSTAMRPEPLTEPLTEPLSYLNIATANAVDTKEGGKQEVREGDNREKKSDRFGGHFIALSQDPVIHLERSRSTIAECYRLAIKHEGKLGGSRVGLALKAGGDPDQVLQDIGDTVEAGGDLGEALSHYWQERMR